MLAEASMVTKIIFLAAAGFLSAFVDSIAGGGGMISVPAYMIVGFPTHFTLGTNKFSATSGSMVSTMSFAKHGKVDKELLKYILPCTFVGAIFGVNTVLLMDPAVLKPLILTLLLLVGIYTLFSKEIGMVDTYEGRTRKTTLLGMILGFATGFYDGFFGPGTGSFIIFGLVTIYGFDFVRASGNAKAMNVVSNLTSLVIFAINGKINFLMGIPMAIFMVFGALAGSKLAIREGSKFVKPIFVLMSVGVAVKMLYEILI